MEQEDDYREVEKMVRDSFWNIYRPGAFEHYIVHYLRDDENFLPNLAYVIEKDSQIIGHINYSTGSINHEMDAVVLGPVSIHKDYQNRGFGSKLIEYTLDIAKNDGIEFVFVIGDENYYHRFGFESASKYGLHLDGTDFNEECEFFMIKIFDKSESEIVPGTFYNPEVFDVCQNDVDEFDKEFEYKKKRVLDTQLKEL